MSSYVKQIPENTVGRDFVVGDVHGCFGRLLTELNRLEFRSSVDRLMSVGDLVDRGSESIAVLEWLGQPWFHAVRGNHEQMALEYLAGEMDADDYELNGGGWFIQLDCELQIQIASQFSRLPVALEVTTASGLVGIVHADCPFESWKQLTQALEGEDAHLIAEYCMSSRDRFIDSDKSGIADVSQVFVGHTPVAVPTCLGNVHYIDSGAVYGHRLTVRRFN